MEAMQPRHPLFIQMSGAPGSGKSMLAGLLATSIDGVVIDHDCIKSFLLDEGSPFVESAEHAYGFQWTLAKDLAKQGRTGIVDSACNYQKILADGISLAQRLERDYKYIECRVDDMDLLDRRLSTRKPMRSQRSAIGSPPPDAVDTKDTQDWLDQFKTWIESPCRPSSGSITVNMACHPNVCLENVLKQLFRNPMKHITIRYTVRSYHSTRMKGTRRYSEDFLHSPRRICCRKCCLLESITRWTRFYAMSHILFRHARVSASLRSFCIELQHRIDEFLHLCVTSGTNAFRAAMKVLLCEVRKRDRTEIIVPAIAPVSTAHAVLMEGFLPVFVDVDPDSFMLSLSATVQATTPKTAAIITVDWLGTTYDILPFRKLPYEHGIKLVSDSARSYGASLERPLTTEYAHITSFSTGFPKVYHTGGKVVLLFAPKDHEASDISRHEAMPELNAYLGLRALDLLGTAKARKCRVDISLASERYPKHQVPTSFPEFVSV